MKGAKALQPQKGNDDPWLLSDRQLKNLSCAALILAAEKFCSESVSLALPPRSEDN